MFYMSVETRATFAVSLEKPTVIQQGFLLNINLHVCTGC